MNNPVNPNRKVSKYKNLVEYWSLSTEDRKFKIRKTYCFGLHTLYPGRKLGEQILDSQRIGRQMDVKIIQECNAKLEYIRQCLN